MFSSNKKNNLLLTSFFLLLIVTSFDLIFQENIPMPRVYSFFKLADEIYILVVFIAAFVKKGKIKNRKLLLLVGYFLIAGFIGNIRLHSTLKIALLGAFTTIKPILLFWAFSQYDFEWSHFYKLMRKFTLVFPIIIFSYILDIYDPDFRKNIGIKAQAVDIRMGLRSLGGIFNRFTNGILFALIYYIYYRNYSSNRKWQRYLAAFMIFSSLKIKDIFGFLFGNILLVFHRFKKRYIFLIVGFCALLFNLYSQIMPEHYDEYFGQKDRSNIARVVLYETSFKILIDKFPFGTGHGTYASPISQQYRSQVYDDYGIGDVYGLSDRVGDEGVFMTDTFWPMIWGETGFIGFILYILILYHCFKSFIFGFSKNSDDKRYIFPAFLFFVFIVSSLGKPVFNGPPHCLVLWGFAGIFQSLKNKNPT